MNALPARCAGCGARVYYRVEFAARRRCKAGDLTGARPGLRWCDPDGGAHVCAKSEHASGNMGAEKGSRDGGRRPGAMPTPDRTGGEMQDSTRSHRPSVKP